MASNFLEQLVAEWLELRDYFVRRNVLVGPRRDKGGYEGELDVVAFHPGSGHCVHFECSTDAESWAKREERFGRKFSLGQEYIPRTIFKDVKITGKIEQVALFVFASTKNRSHVGGGRVVTVTELLSEIREALKQRPVESSAVPEGFVILRALQFAVHKWR